MTLPRMDSATSGNPGRRIPVRRVIAGLGLLLFVFNGLSLFSREKTWVVKAGKIYTATENGILTNGAIVIRNGEIVDIGTDIVYPDDADVVDLRDGFVMPGIISPDSNLGIYPRDTAPPPAFRRPEPRGRNLTFYPVLYSISPDHLDYRLAVMNGFTTLAVSPPPAGLSGMGSIIRPGDGTLDDMLVKENAFLKIAFYAHTAFRTMLKRSLDEARNRLDKLDKEHPPESDADDRTVSGENTRFFMKVVEGTLPLIADCPEPGAVAHLLDLLSPHSKIRLVIRGGPDTPKAGALLKTNGIPVILEPDIGVKTHPNIPYPERTNYVLECQNLGLTMAFQAPGNIETQIRLFHYLNRLHRYGVCRDILLKGVTIVPAQVLGIDDLVGSLEKGKRADLIILEADPLEHVPVIVGVMSGGTFIQ